MKNNIVKGVGIVSIILALAGCGEKKHDNTIPTITKENIDSVFSRKYTLVYAGAKWCYPCVRYGPIFNGISEKYSGRNISFVKMDLTEYENGKELIDKLHEKGSIKTPLKKKTPIDLMPVTIFYFRTSEVNRKFGKIDSVTLSNSIDSLLKGKFNYRKDYDLRIRDTLVTKQDSTGRIKLDEDGKPRLYLKPTAQYYPREAKN